MLYKSESLYLFLFHQDCLLSGVPGGGEYRVSEIRIKENESLDSALRRFKRQCAKSGVMAEVRKREHYEKPSESARRSQRQLEKENIDPFNALPLYGIA